MVALTLCFFIVLNGTFFKLDTEASDGVVRTEAELLNAISVAPDNAEYVIGLSADIILKNSLEIPVGKTIVLVGVGDVIWRLVGANNQNTINVAGSLTIDGICVTHADGDTGRGVYVARDGMFTMLGGVITGNIMAGTTYDDVGGGVFVNYGAFVMLGGEITGNTASSGGGMYSIDSLVDRRGGTIWGNTATHATSSYNDVAEVSISRRPSDDNSPY
jgi:hypothetical protein